MKIKAVNFQKFKITDWQSERRCSSIGTMSKFSPRQLGEQVPDSPHAVCVHFPALADVIGYEEGEETVLSQLKGGYPRFVLHPYIRDLADHLKTVRGLSGRHLALVPSRRSARELSEYVLDDSGAIEEDRQIFIYHCEANEENRRRCREFLQHTGCSISSRLAEDRLLETGLLFERHVEEVVESRAGIVVRQEVGDLARSGRPDSVLLCNSGMNAFYSAYKAVRDYMESEERDLWIQLGWLYLDTNRILERFGESVGKTEVFLDIHDHERVEAWLERNGQRVAGCVTEVPTNPLLGTVDLDWLRCLADRYGFILIIDPTLASSYNVEVLPYADVLIQSLTKYCAYEGDVIMGAAIFNTRRSLSMELLARAVGHHEPPYKRDLERLAYEIGETPGFIRQVNRTTALVASFLEEHPGVERVFWAYSKWTRSEYEKIGRWPLCPGGVLSFLPKESPEAFYDRCPLVKGPSFGTRFSILCPYIYLAHYDLVSSAEGRARLAEAGLNPGLMRLSVGLEDPETIIEALRVGLEGLAEEAHP